VPVKKWWLGNIQITSFSRSEKLYGSKGMKNVLFLRENIGNQVNLFINTREVIDILPTG
jgi:hypothetical protein